jgi:regulator of replication initiation timing
MTNEVKRYHPKINWLLNCIAYTEDETGILCFNKDVQPLLSERDELQKIVSNAIINNELLKKENEKLREEVAKCKQTEKENMARNYLKTFESEDKE